MGWVSGLSLSRKLVLLVMSITLFTLTTSSGFHLYHDYLAEKRHLTRELFSLAELMGLNTRAALVFRDREAARRNLESLRSRTPILAAYVTDSQGQILARYRKEPNGGPEMEGRLRRLTDLAPNCRPRQQGSDRLCRDEYLFLEHSIRLEGQKVGQLFLQAEESSLEERVLGSVTATMVGSAAALLVALVLALRLQRLISQPLVELTRAMEGVPAGRQIRLSAPDRKDEIGRLLCGFNRMTEQLAARDRELEEINENLEAKVARRTRDLHQKNLELEKEIVARRRVEEDLRVKDQAIAAAIDGIALATPEGLITYVNHAFVRLWDLESRDQALGEPVEKFWHQPERAAKVRRELAAAGYWVGELRARLADGSLREMQVSASVVCDQNGRPACLMAAFVDVSERKQIEENLRRSLQEKEILVREVHHRVKNNLQVIASLLNLQRKKSAQADTRRELAAVRNRIVSMGLIHEKLYLSDDLSQIDFFTYVSEAAEQLFTLYQVDRERIQLKKDIAEIELQVDIAIPLGMVVNELLTNALKYAFPGGRRGKITVCLAEGGHGLRLQVADDGVGLPDAFDSRESPTLGMQLVHSLARQLGGELRFESGGGTRVILDCVGAGAELAESEGYGLTMESR